jgi:hypothetical protein
MPFWLVHAGTALQKVTTAGEVSTLTLPDSLTIVATRRGRFAVLGKQAAFVNAGVANLVVDATDGTVRRLSMATPSGVPTLASGGAGVLTGAYQYWVSFAEMNGAVVVSESGIYGPSASFTASAQKIALSAIPTSAAAACNARRIYRSLSGGTAAFLCTTIGDNTATTYTDNATDASISSVAAPTDLGNPEGTTSTDRLVLIEVWRDRLWAVPTTYPDRVLYSGLSRFFAWNATQYLDVPIVGQDASGVTAFLPRRDELGIAKRRALWKLVGDTAATFRLVQVVGGPGSRSMGGVGVVAPESVVVIRDTAFFLAEDGVYTWDATGLTRISDRVAAWFRTDDFFNRAQFVNAAGTWDPREDSYVLHLAGAGSAVRDRWVTCQLPKLTWLGPHKTSAFTPSAAGDLEDGDGLPMAVVGDTAGYLYRNGGDEIWHDDPSTTAIDYDVTTGWHAAGAPALQKMWGQLTVHSQIEPAAGTCQVTPKVGGLNAAAGAVITLDLRKGLERVRRLGIGPLCQIRFQEATSGQGCALFGYEFPVAAIGRR